MENNNGFDEKQMSVDTATGKALDAWGVLLNVPRIEGLSDEEYRKTLMFTLAEVANILSFEQMKQALVNQAKIIETHRANAAEQYCIAFVDGMYRAEELIKGSNGIKEAVKTLKFMIKETEKNVAEKFGGKNENANNDNSQSESSGGTRPEGTNKEPLGLGKDARVQVGDERIVPFPGANG